MFDNGHAWFWSDWPAWNTLTASTDAFGNEPNIPPTAALLSAVLSRLSD
jgi:hypothetical protein